MPGEKDKLDAPPPAKTAAKNLAGIPVKENSCISVYLPFLAKQRRTVGIGQSAFASGNNSALGTEQLASCYALIVLGQTKQGTPLLGMHHWIGDDLRAEEALTEMKDELLRRGAEQEQFKCLALGGHSEFPAMKNEIQELMQRGLIQAALFDLNEGDENTALIISIAPDNKIFIDYETKKEKAVEENLEGTPKNLPSYLTVAPQLSLKEQMVKAALAKAKLSTIVTTSVTPPASEHKSFKNH